MLIVLEGCDGSGKTTLATFLSNLFDAEIVHCSTHTPNDYEFFMNIVEMARTKNIIADRWCYGQFVYQTESERPLRDKNGMFPRDAEEVLRDLEIEMLKTGTKVIFVTAKNWIIEQRLRERSEKLINELTVSEVQNRFKKVMKHSLLNWVEYDTGGTQNV